MDIMTYGAAVKAASKMIGGSGGKNYIYKWETHDVGIGKTLSIEGMGRLIPLCNRSDLIKLQELDGNSYNNIQCFLRGVSAYINFNKSITIMNSDPNYENNVAIELLVEEEISEEKFVDLSSYYINYPNNGSAVVNDDGSLLFNARYGASWAPTVCFLCDLTDINTVEFTLSGVTNSTGEHYVGVSSTNNITGTSALLKKAEYVNQTGSQTISLDVSDLSGNQYLAVTLGGSKTDMSVLIESIKTI